MVKWFVVVVFSSLLCARGSSGVLVSHQEHDSRVIGIAFDGGSAFMQQHDSLANERPAKIIQEIERAIGAEDAMRVAQFFGKQVYISLQSNEGAYYSSNQALYVLQNFFDSQRITAFKFTSVNVANSTSYATGAARIKAKAHRTMIQVYVSLARVGDRWVISQFNVY